MNKEEFEKGYAERSGMTIEWLRANGRQAAQCDCGEEGCQGWQMAHVVNDETEQDIHDMLDGEGEATRSVDEYLADRKDYTEWADQELVAEVARRMPRDTYHVNEGEVLRLDGGLWLNWLPMTNANDLEDVKREIRSWGWGHKERWIPRIQKWNVEAVRIPPILNQQGSFKAKDGNRGRAWLLAFLRVMEGRED